MHRIISDYTNVETSSNIKVYVRARPPEDNALKIDFIDTKSDPEHKRIVIKDPDTNNKKYSEVVFQFDKIFWVEAQQIELFNTVCRPQVDHVLRGYNACCFAYGQTGSGKTYSMFGESGELRGMIPRSVEYLFETLASKDGESEYSLSCTFLEIYNDAVRDLGKAYLVASGMGAQGTDFIHEKTSDLFHSISKKRQDSYYAPAFKRVLANSSLNSTAFADLMNQPGLRSVQEEYLSMHYDIREDGEGNVFVKDLSNIRISTIAEVMAVINMGLKVRATHETKMNNTSSRSHTVFTITVLQRDRASGASVSGMLNLVDLAGSERLKKSESQGARLKEALHINTSLTALGKVVMALEQAADKQHVPYRDSKLTRILQNSLGGNSYTTLMAAIHPCPAYYDECLSTLQFANRCRNVTNNPRVNYVGGSEMEDKDRKIKRLMEEIVQLRAKLAQYERGGGAAGAFTGIALAEKIQVILKKVGISASIGADGSLKMEDGRTVSLEELNDVAIAGNPEAEEKYQAETVKTSGGRSTEKLNIIISELESANAELRLKYKAKKQQAEEIGKEFEQLNNEFNRCRQDWQHKEYELRKNSQATSTHAKGIESLLKSKHEATYAELVARNQELLEQQHELLKSIPKNLKTLTTTSKVEKDRTQYEIVQPIKEAYDRLLQDMEASRQKELENQKQQFEYYLKAKDDTLRNMTTAFNKYREKKSGQLRKCEQEIVKLFTYAEKLEGIVKAAEAGKFYIQHTQIAGREADTGGGGGLLIPQGTLPRRPGADVTARGTELELSQRIMNKHLERIRKDERVKNEAMEAILQHHGSADEKADNGIIDEELQEQIRGMMTSPSIGRDLIATASSQAATSRAATKEPSKRHTLFAAPSPRSARSDTGPPPAPRRHTAFTRASTVQGPPARAAQTLNQNKTDTVAKSSRRPFSASLSKQGSSVPVTVIESTDTQENSTADPDIFAEDGSYDYVFPNSEGKADATQQGGNAMLFSPSNSATGSKRHPKSSSSTNQEVIALRNEVAQLKMRIAEMEEVDNENILDQIDGNETIEYIQQLENERSVLRNSVRETSAQLQKLKVANASLTRQYEALRVKCKRPSSGARK